VSGRPVVLPAVEATAIGVVLEIIETWLRGAPEEVIASLAASAYGQPTARALSWARDLISDLRYYSGVLASAVRADDPEGSAF
jgi:hypothetical protein